MDRLNNNFHAVSQEAQNGFSRGRKKGSLELLALDFTKFIPAQNKYVEHRLLFEECARLEYEQSLQVTVVKFGLIFCERHPWLRYPQEGVIFLDNKPVKGIEIKCPFAEKTQSIRDVMEEQDFKHLIPDGDS